MIFGEAFTSLWIAFVNLGDAYICLGEALIGVGDAIIGFGDNIWIGVGDYINDLWLIGSSFFLKSNIYLISMIFL
jgi:hypothetical protein